MDSVTKAFSFKLQAERADAKLRNYIAKKHLLRNTSIKEEVSLVSTYFHTYNLNSSINYIIFQNINQEFSSNIVIKTENKNIDGFDSKLDDDFDMSGQNACSDDSDDFKPLNGDFYLISHLKF